MGKRLMYLVFLACALMMWPPVPASAQKVVKIGDLGSKVGVFEGYGKYQTMAIQMAVEELNAKGGVLGHKIEIISEDDETKPAPAVRKAEKPLRIVPSGNVTCIARSRALREIVGA